LEIRTETIADVPVVSIVGEVDRLSGKTLKRAIADVLQNGEGPPCLLVDLSECTYVDAVALSVLMSARERLAAGHCLGLVGASGSIRNLFSLIGFTESDTLHFLASRNEAEELVRTLAETRGAGAPVRSGPPEGG